MPSTLPYKKLGIGSPQEAAELEQDLDIRFNNLTPRQCETWKQQTVYLGLFAQTRTFTHAARAAGVTVRKVRTWQAENTLGFNQRLELAVLEYSEEIDLMLLEHARRPDCPPSLFMMFVRAQMPEKYGPARRESAPQANHSDCNHDPTPATSQDDHHSLDDIRQDLQQLKQFAGLTDPATNALQGIPADQPSPAAAFTPAPKLSYNGEDASNPKLSLAGRENTIPFDLSPAEGETQRGGILAPNGHALHQDTPQNTSFDASPAGAGFIPAHTHTPHLPAPGAQNPAPALSRRQRRELQRRSKRKHQSSHRPRAPN